MSVRSEFTRIVASCTDLLDASEAGAGAGLADSLHAARAVAATDLSGAAERVLELAERTSGRVDLEFRNALDREDFDARFEHAVAIARVILGRSATH